MTKFLGEEGTKEVLSLIKELIKILLETKEDILQDPYQHFAVLKTVDVGDAVFYDNTTGKMVIVDPDKVNSTDYPASRYTPIGVIAIPSSHDVYGTGEGAMVSLNYMNYSTPDSGSTDTQYIYWGLYNVDTNLKNYNVCVQTGTHASPTQEASGTQPYCYMPSDNFESRGYLTYPGDDNSYYYYNSTLYAVPSPYLSDGSRNPVYYQTESPSTEYNCLSDFNGIGNTQVLLDLATVQSDWKTASTITNNYNSGYSPAACCCWRYSTDGTQQGDWYLPACGEFGYVIARLKKINSTISTLNSIYSVGSTISTSNYFWSSTEYSSTLARSLYTYSGRVYGYDKNSNNYVRAFCRVQP